MVKLAKYLSDSLGRIKPTKPKVRTSETEVTKHVKKRPTSATNSGFSSKTVDKTPVTDTFEHSESKVNQTRTSKPTSALSKTYIGDFLVHKNKILAEAYKNDLEKIAMVIPEVSFFRDANNTSAKELKSILEKLKKRSEQFIERGYKGVIRDGVRATIFMPNADKNYMKIVDAMKKKGYKIAKNFKEDVDEKIVLDAAGKPVMIDDIDVRFGKNACKSGYEDVQIRFQKGDVLYELIILPGPHYMSTKNKEHEIYDQFKRYKANGFEKDLGAKQIVNAIKEKFAGLTRLWYADAKQRDMKGVSVAKETPTFSEEDIKDLNGLFKSLKNLYLGKFNTLSPSKRPQAVSFKDTKTFQTLNDIECELKKVMDIYKPVTKPADA